MAKCYGNRSSTFIQALHRIINKLYTVCRTTELSLLYAECRHICMTGSGTILLDRKCGAGEEDPRRGRYILKLYQYMTGASCLT
jgi:hypothetical protein